jgi:LL-diaminopimelate aminotransferase
MIKRSERLNKLPPYLFHEIDVLRQDAIANGVDVVDLGIGDPDLPTPMPIIEMLHEAAQKAENHRYPSQIGLVQFRQEATQWLKKQFNIQLDEKEETLILIGTKEGIAHLPLAVLNPGDVALIPDPGYPVYRSGVIFAGGTPVVMPLLKENKFLPDLDAIEEDILKKAKLLYINYPNNPTSAIADTSFFSRLVDMAREYEFLICHDASYSEITFDGYRAPSILQIEGAKEVAIEMHSLSKTYNMTGWRVGFAVGNKTAISALATLKNNIDSGVFNAIQYAGITALNLPESYRKEILEIYDQRRELLCDGLKRAGFTFQKPKATFYVWVNVPEDYDSMAFSAFLLKELGVIATPGIGFGTHGESFIRFSLTAPTERIKEAVRRLKEKLGSSGIVGIK